MISFLLLTVWLTTLATTAAHSAPVKQSAPETAKPTASQPLTLRDTLDREKQLAIRAFKRQHEGRILHMQRYKHSYRFKIIDNAGRVKTVEIDRASLRHLPPSDSPKYMPHPQKQQEP
jgi:hypothetical protein